jgi:acyl-CoA reductase-like NAD-dependent aldehyde dehydrogenase
MRDHQAIYIDGAWVKPEAAGRVELFDSSTGAVMATVAAGGAADASRAAEAARAAFEGWSRRPAAERADLVDRIADGLSARADELADVVTREAGTPISVSAMVHGGLPPMSYRGAAEIARRFEYERPLGSTRVLREPVGVVAAITPWNYPPHQIAAKVGPALAAGCTVVLKPAEVASLDAILLAEVVDEVGLPPGVLNVVTGPGRVVGEALVTHPEVDMVSFTGSTGAGSRIAALAAGSITRVALELGGKSACVLLDDLDEADFKRAVVAGLAGCLLNAGQTCVALTRLVVPAARLKVAEEIVVDQIERKWQPGNPLEATTRLGALASQAQVDSVLGYVETGIAEGARLIVGGTERPTDLGGGYYVAPTAFSSVRNDMAIAQEEIFGPVLSIIPHQGDEDATAIANDSPFGLSGAVWAGDASRAEAVARRVRTGTISVNGAMPNLRAPFGGFKQSGYGREYGEAGFEEFLELRSLNLPG